MPRELLAVAPRTPQLREYVEPALGPRQIRIRTTFASPKHGSELVGYRNDLSARRVYDAQLGLMAPLSDQEVSARFPRRLGNMAVGEITEVGSEVGRFQPGDMVFGHFPVRETQTVDETNADLLPQGMSPETIVCLDPAVMALAMRDATIRLGDHVAVFGMGAIGLMAVQLAKIAGADKVFAVDPIESRRMLAMALGADDAVDPFADGGDPARAIRESSGVPPASVADEHTRVRVLGGYHERPTQVGQRGVDVAVEVSGNTRALHQAIRATRYGGTICVLSYYGGEAVGLGLGDEFHVNRLQLVSARSESLPLRDAPAWTLERIVRLALSWLASGRLRTDGIVAPIVPFADAAEAYREIDEHPEKSVKLGIRFS